MLSNEAKKFLEEVGRSSTDIEDLTRWMMSGCDLLATKYSGPNRSNRNLEVGEIYKLQKDWGLLPQLKEKPKKSNEEAQKQRLKGNQAYKARNLTEALKYYTRAICCAESGSEEMSVAFGNRSAVTYELEEYQNSINDINRAFSTGNYPTNLTQKLFERRGKCFLALQQYEKASEDFRQAIHDLQSGGNPAKMKTVKDYLTKCEGKQDIPVKPAALSPKLTHGPSPCIQSASSAVEIKFSPEMGRHIVAAVDIAPGDILAIEKPFLSTIDPKGWEIFCDNCKKRCHASIPCGSCNNVVFCSEQCRETSWGLYHAIECNILHHLANLGCKSTVRLAIRMLLKATRMGKNLHVFMNELEEPSLDADVDPEKVGFVGNVYPSDHYQPIHNLANDKEHRGRLNLLKKAIVSSTIFHILKEGTTFFDHTDFAPDDADFNAGFELQWNHLVAANLLMKYQLMVSINAYQTEETRWKWVGDKLHNEIQLIGEAVYAFLSLRNHSCEPNSSTFHYEGDTMVMVASKTINKGQEIFGRYYNSYALSNKSERQMHLKENFFFTCKCTACIEDWPLLSDLSDEPSKFVSAEANRLFNLLSPGLLLKLSEIISKNLKDITSEELQHLVKCVIFFQKHVRLPWRSYYLCQRVMLDYFAYTYNPYILKDPQSC